MQLFYAPDLNEGDAFAILSREESHHAVKVLRMQAGDEMFVTNGRGLGGARYVERPFAFGGVR